MGGSIENSPLDVKLKELRDYYMTNSVARASPTMAKCVAAVSKEKEAQQQQQQQQQQAAL